MAPFRLRTSNFILLLALLPGAAEAQPSNLSGTWVATKDAPRNLPPAPGAVLGQQFAVRQDGQTLTVTRRVRDTNVTAAFPIGGGEVRTRIPGPLCMADSESIEQAAWDGGALALTIVGTVPPGGTDAAKLNIRRVLRLDGADTLVVEGMIRESAQAPPRPVATVYKRSPEPMTGAPAAAPAPTASRIAQLAWLSGTWVAETGSDERWTPAASGAMIGVARTMRNGVVSAFEFLCIVERAGGLVYQAMPGGRSPATDFTLTRIEANSATFENPSHDFPKTIRYSLRGDGTLEAIVSGDPKQRALTFTFRRQQ